MKRIYIFLSVLLSCWTCPELAQAQTVLRGPYLQNVTSNSVVIRWRTNTTNIGSVDYGTTMGILASTETAMSSTTEHELQLTGLSPNTRYYYQIKAGATVLVGNDAEHYFDTAPIIGDATQDYTAWFLGDCGTGNANAASVRDAFYNVAGHTDLMIFLGDNAYNDGTDGEYQAGVFDMYPAALRNTVAYSCTGNHEFYNGGTDSPTQTGPYYDIFTHPTAGEGGGILSGTEAYYSFDYGNIHFISLDSYDSDRSVGGAMYNWLQMDLANTTQDWIVAYFHHNSYTKGSHDSDTESYHIQMRQNIAPLLETYGVDLILSGHSHSYERSMLINGHYGFSGTFDPATHIVTSGNGDKMGRYEQMFGSALPIDCAYVKNGTEGAVYIVAGSSGKVSSGSFDHPVYIVNLMQLGSTFLKVNGNRLDVSFIQNNEQIGDVFTIFKNVVDPSTVCVNCPPAMTVCDDGNPNTINDTADGFCNCIGTPCGANTIDVRVNSSDDDAEEENGTGAISLTSSDMELISDGGTDQTVGLRFTNLNIPQGATITNAYIQFTVDETNSGVTNLNIAGEDEDNALAFTAASFNISSRTTTTATVAWNGIPAWSIVGEAGLDQRTPSLIPIVQEIVDRGGWGLGNAMSFIITGTGERTAESYNGVADFAPLLHIAFEMSCATCPAAAMPCNDNDPFTINDAEDGFCNCAGTPVCGTTTLARAIGTSSEDAEEDNTGSIGLASSDIELVDDPTFAGNDQTVGLRFSNLNIPQGAFITNAYIQFAVDEADSGVTNLVIEGEDEDDAAVFNTTPFNISSRTRTTAAVTWNAVPAWTTIGAAGLDQQTPDLSTIVQEIVNRGGWNTGNAMSFIITGSGERTAESYDGGTPPILHIEYSIGVCLSLKAFLQGAYNGTDMDDHLNALGVLPSTEPYSALGHTPQNAGASMYASTSSLTAGDKIVDWVLVELRNPSTTVIASTVALLQKDGDIVGTDGTSHISFPGIAPNNYYVVVRHRNHLGVMTALPMTLD